MKLALFGGTFDPPHIGHEQIVKKALSSLNIDRLIVIPTFQNPFKHSSRLTGEQRLYLLEKLFSYNDTIIIDPIEVNSQTVAYSIDTVHYIQKKYDTLKPYFIMGADNYTTLSTWKQYQKLQQMILPVVVTRKGFSHQWDQTVLTLDVDINVSSTQLRDNLDLTLIPSSIQDDVNHLMNR